MVNTLYYRILNCYETAAICGRNTVTIFTISSGANGIVGNHSYLENWVSAEKWFDLEDQGELDITTHAVKVQ